MKSSLEKDSVDLDNYLKSNTKVEIRKEGNTFIVHPVERASFWMNSGTILHRLVKWCDSHFLNLDKSKLINVVEESDCWRCKNCGAEWSHVTSEDQVPEICNRC